MHVHDPAPDRPPRAHAVRVVLAVAALAAALLATGCAGRDDRPDLILITVDTLRADRLGAYGDDQADTPAIDGLAARGAKFTRVSAVTPVTLPSHASLLTGRYPSSNGVRNNGTFRLGDDEVSLAESLSGAGWRTSAVVGAVVLAARYGLAQGFESYDDAFGASGRSERRAAEVTDAALARAAEVPASEPWFLWAHYFDPHASYDPPSPFDDTADRYRGEIAYTDHEIGRLLDGLERAGRLDNAVVVVVADHGEAFGEHGETQHGLFVYEPTIHVPMIVAWPGRVPEGTVVDTVASHVDLAPTLLALLGLPAPPSVDGIDLSPAVLGTGAPEGRRGVRIENLLPRLEFGWSPLHAHREGDWKYIACPRPELYDLSADPREEDNLVDDQPRRAQVASHLLAEALTGEDAARADAGTTMDAATVEQLRSLGYVGSTSAPPVEDAGWIDATLPDPKDRLEEYRSAKKISAHLARGEFDAAAAESRRALATDPDNLRVLHQLGEALLRSGRVVEGEQVYRKILETEPTDCIAMWRRGEIEQLARDDAAAADAWYRDSLDCEPAQPDVWWRRAGLVLAGRVQGDAAALLDRAIELDPMRATYRDRRAELAYEAGDLDRAAVHWRAALDARPDDPRAAAGLARIAADRGDADEAERRFRQAIESDPGLAGAHAGLGALLLRQREYDAGIVATRRALELAPELTQARFNLAMALVRTERLDEAREELARYAADAPGDPRGWEVLARALERAGRTRDARPAWERVLAVDPAHPEARRALGR